MPAVVLDELVDAVLSYVRELVLGLLPGQGPSDREDGTAFAHGLLVFVARARRVGCASRGSVFYGMRVRVRHVEIRSREMQDKK